MSQTKIIVCSLPNFDELVAEMYVADEFVGLLSQEMARGTFIFEPGKDLGKLNLPLDTFEGLLREARSALSKVG